MTLHYFRPLLLAATLLFGSAQLYAQKLSKAEKKAIVKEIRKMNKDLEGFRKLLMQEGELDKKIKEKTVEITSKRSEVDKKQKELRDKKIAVQKLHDEIKALSKAQKEVNASPQRTEITPSDTVFKIMIGSYTKQDLSEFTKKYFVVEPYQNPNDDKTYYRHCIGHFPGNRIGAWEASYFEKYLMKVMQKKGKYKPYVVGYANGKIIIDIGDYLLKKTL